MLNGMIVEPVDNVVVAIEPVKKGETVTYMCAGEEKRLTAAEDITIYHKLAACDIAKGQPIVKYGEHIGLAARDIKAGAVISNGITLGDGLNGNDHVVLRRFNDHSIQHCY